MLEIKILHYCTPQQMYSKIQESTIVEGQRRPGHANGHVTEHVNAHCTLKVHNLWGFVLGDLHIYT